MQHSQTFKYLRQLEDDYFDRLDSQGINYFDHTTYDQGYSEVQVKPEFDVSHSDMALFLGYESVNAYLDAQKKNDENSNVLLALEHQLGRFYFSYEGQDLNVYDVKDDQAIVVSLSYDEETIKQLCMGIAQTFIKYKKALGGLT